MMPVLLLALILSGGVGPAPGITTQKAGVRVGRAQTLNLTGTAVTSCTQSGSTTTCTLTDTSGAGNLLAVSVTLNATTSTGATVVIGQTWVGANSNVICVPLNDGAVTNNTDEVYQVAELSWVVSTRVAGTGFTLSALSLAGATGAFNFSCTGQ